MKKPLKVLTSLLLLTMAVGCDKKETPADNPSGDPGNNGTTIVTPTDNPGGDAGNGGTTIVTPEDKDNNVTMQVTSKVYDGKPINVIVNALSGGNVSLQYKNKNADDSTYTSDAPKNAGEYTVKASVEKGNGYKKADSIANFSITKKEVEIVWTAPSNLVYDGTPKEASAGIKSDSVVEGDTVTLTYGLTSGKDNVNSGSFTYTVTAISNENYKLPSNVVSPSYAIGKATPTYTVPTGLTAVYGQTLADVNLPTGFSFESPLHTTVGNAGTNEFLVTYDMGNANYASVNNIPVSISVSKADPTYTIPTNITATYGQMLKDIVMPNGYYFEEDPSTLVGNVGVVTHSVRFYPSNPENYNVVTNIPINITVKKADVVLVPLEPATANVGDTLADITLPSGYSFMEDLSTLVGPAGNNTHKLTFTPDDTDNYNVTTDIDFTINVSKLKSSVPSISVPSIDYKENLTLSDFTLPNEDFSFANPNLKIDKVGRYQVEVIYQNPDVDTYAPLSFYTYVEVKQATPTYVVPAGLTAFVGQQLKDVSLPLGFAFEDAKSTSVGEVGVHYFNATYTNPDDSKNYKRVSNIPVAIEVSKNDNQINYVGCLSKNYDGDPLPLPSVRTQYDGPVTYLYKPEGADDSEYSLTRPVNAGSYEIKAIVGETDATNEVIGYCTSNIWRIRPSIEFLDSFPRVYEENVDAIDINGQYLYGGDGEVSVSYAPVSNGNDGTSHNTPASSGAYIDGVPTEAGTYYLKLTAAQGTNYLTCNTTCVVEIYNSSALNKHTIEVTNLADLSAPYDNTTRKPNIKIDGSTASVNSYKWYIRTPNSLSYYQQQGIQSAGKYNFIVVAQADSDHCLTVYEFSVDVPLGDYTGNISWYGKGDATNKTATYGQTLRNLTNASGYMSIEEGSVYFNDPLDTPVGNPGTNKFSVTFVPKQVTLANGVKADAYKPVVKNDYEIKVYKINSINVEIPDEIKNIVLVPGTTLSNYSLPAGWVFSNINSVINSSYAGGTYDAYINYGGDEYNDIVNNRRVTLNVSGLPRNYARILAPKNNIVYNFGGGIRVCPNIYFSESDIEDNAYDIYVIDDNSLGVDYGFIAEFKSIDAPDSEYTQEVPTENGEYIVKITLLGGPRLETKEIYEQVDLRAPKKVLEFEDIEENVTYVLYRTSSIASQKNSEDGVAYAYDGVGYDENTLKQMNPTKVYNFCLDEAFSNIIGVDTLIIYDNADEIKLFSLSKNENAINKITLGDPVGIIVSPDEDMYGNLHIETLVLLYEISGEDIENTNIVIFCESNCERLYNEGDDAILSEYKPLLGMEFCFVWEEQGEYIHLLPDGFVGSSFFEEIEDQPGYYTWTWGEYYTHAYNEDVTLCIVNINGSLYLKALDGVITDVNEMLNSEPMWYGNVEYIEDIGLYKLLSHGILSFFEINENNELVMDDTDAYPQETYIVEDDYEVTVYTLPDNSKITFDLGPIYSYTYNDETKVLSVCYDSTNSDTDSLLLNDDGTATIYIGEEVIEYDLTMWSDNFKAYVGEFNGRMYMKIYEVNYDGTLTYFRHFEVVYNAEKNRYETTDGYEWYTINDDGTLTYDGVIS